MNEALLKTESWNGHDIRFIAINDEWYAVASDVASAMGFRDASSLTRNLEDTYKGAHKVSTLGGEQEMVLINEEGLYRVIMRSNKPETEEFQHWVYQMIKALRKSIGLEGFEIFRTLDKEHQNKMMSRIPTETGIKEASIFIKANTITNTAIKKMYGLDGRIKKEEMTPQMLLDREPILEATTDLLITQAKYGVPDHVSQVIYEKFAN